MTPKEVYVLTILNKPVACSDYLRTLFTDEVFFAAFVNATGDQFTFDGSMSVFSAYAQASRAINQKGIFASFTKGGTRPFNYSVSKATYHEGQRKN